MWERRDHDPRDDLRDIVFDFKEIDLDSQPLTSHEMLEVLLKRLQNGGFEVIEASTGIPIKPE